MISPIVVSRSRNWRRGIQRCESGTRRLPSSSGRKRNRSTRTFATNDNVDRDEIVEAVFVFHRHGDRTPGKSLVADEFMEEEALFWQTKIPPSDRSYYEMLSERFPVTRLGNRKDHKKGRDDFSFKDTLGGNESYGFLTWKGMHQMYHNGVAMANRYRRRNECDSGLPFQELWDIQAVSTNYLRTVKSCQAFLDGLTSSKSVGEVELDYRQPTHYEGIDIEEYNRKRNTHGTSVVEIQVRDGKNNTLNAFDSSPDIMKKLVGEVFATEDFIENDTRAAPLAAQLCEYIPGLSKYSSYGGRSSSSGINWIHAADHFICRSSHSVPVTEFSSHLHQKFLIDPTAAEKEFESLGQTTLSHLLFRFRSYYTNPSLIAEMAGPALHEIRLQMNGHVEKNRNRMCNNGEVSVKKPFRIFSCHDVTLLGLLYAVKDRFLKSNDALSSQWPTYASCLTFELVRLKRKRNERDEDEFVVKVWLNEAPIPAFSVASVEILTGLNSKPKDEINLVTFNKLVNELTNGMLSKST